MRDQIVSWLKTQKETIEALICDAAETFAAARHIDKPSSNFLFDLAQGERESLALSRGEDLCYDRYTIGMSYALWYQGRRLNTSLSFCTDFVAEAIRDKKPIEIFDLGAGTGAVQIAIGLCMEAVQQSGQEPPKVRVINVDISPFMLDFNRSFLWKAFRNRYPAMKNLKAEFSVNSWMNPENIRLETPYVVASYLFDHSENREEIAKHFEAIIKLHRPEKLVLLTSRQANKQRFLDKVAEHLQLSGYANKEVLAQNIFTGYMHKLQAYRENFNSCHREVLSTRTPSWTERSFYARLLERTDSKLALVYNNGEGKAREIDDLNLYMPPIKIRRAIKLNDLQKKAAQLNNRPTVITGPAGCGKSVVITERVKNLCEQTFYEESLRILITTFNKSLIDYLSNWLEDILNGEKARRRGRNFYFGKSPYPNIQLMNFDVLPARIGKHRGILEFDNVQRSYLQQAVTQVCQPEGIDCQKHKEILDSAFLLDEYERVIYGQQYDSLEKYQTGKRFGRPFNLYYNSEKREIIWKVIMAYLNRLEKEDKASIHTRRHKLLRNLRDGQYRGMFTHIFVDEFQDCTQADYQIFYGLLKDNNQLTIAGDYAQAVHLGKSAAAPREDEVFMGKTQMSRRVNIRLDGSFRLPFRISECIKPLSAFIKTEGVEDTDIITPYKGAPPGARPIVVYASGTEEMKNKLLWIFWYFQVFDLFDADLPRRKKITVLERDYPLCKALNDRLPEISETDTILRLKGMEKDCIVWSTRAGIEDVEDVYYYIYTILTRTCSVLIIALFDNTPGYAYRAISYMEEKRLMFWDEVTENVYRNNLQQIAALSV